MFRAVRWGDEEAHGRGAALQYGYLKSKGAFAWDAGQKRFRVDDDAMAAGIRDIVADIVRLQGDGDYAGMVAFFDRYAHLDDHALEAIAPLKAIPVDIAQVSPDQNGRATSRKRMCRIGSTLGGCDTINKKNN